MEWVVVQDIMIFSITYTYIKRVDVSRYRFFILLFFFITWMIFIFISNNLMVGSRYEVKWMILQEVVRVIHADTSWLLMLNVEVRVGEVGECIIILVVNYEIAYYACCLTFIVRILKHMLEPTILPWDWILLGWVLLQVLQAPLTQVIRWVLKDRDRGIWCRSLVIINLFFGNDYLPEVRLLILIDQILRQRMKVWWRLMPLWWPRVSAGFLMRPELLKLSIHLWQRYLVNLNVDTSHH